MKYSKIKSDYIRNRLAETVWADRRYIDDLIRLLQFVTLKVTTASTARSRSVLQQQYPDDWLELCREHSEDKYQHELAQREAARQFSETATARTEADRKAQEAQSRRDWESAGGQP